MSKLNSYSRLKVKRDTFYQPDSQGGGVYFRNNVNSFQMKGDTIYQWIEKLMPMFNGERTLADLTEGLTASYRDRVYEIGEILYNNGFVRDASQDIPHQLNSTVLAKYASQIEFIENFTDSGGYRFQEYRQAKVLAVGYGPFLVSLISALIESGLPKHHFIVTSSSIPTNRLRINELVQNAKSDDTEVEVTEVSFEKEAERSFWKQTVQPYDWILYVSPDGNVNELRNLNLVCKEEKKSFLSAICIKKAGFVGPLVHPESEGCWESAWRRIHRFVLKEDEQSHQLSLIAGSILANIVVFEFFKKATGIADSNQRNQIYQLNLDTLEGNWMSFITHPLVTSRRVIPKQIEDLDLRIEQQSIRNDLSSNVFEYFGQLTSKEIGIFHAWEERNLKQLPLSQCYIQVVNPISKGPAELLPEVICSGFTHEEAKREAGLTGIEMYVSQLVYGFRGEKNDARAHIPEGFIGIGAGETIEEAVCRGLQSYLDEELRKRRFDQLNPIIHIQMGRIEDKQCRFYLNALTSLNGTTTIGLENKILGFPVIWVRTHGNRYTSTGLNKTMALRRALKQALMNTQNNVNSLVREKTESSKKQETKLQINLQTTLQIPSCNDLTQLELLQSSIKVLNQNSKRLFVYDFSAEPFLKKKLAGVFGVQVREGES
ncbi:putative thiazole-containing bacteriocin maturation protein [Bacillus sp. B15-48]|uniref:putative thiazole-containing bacteriocin maturation protein n=1 Tax=Bacillus sp. B15-48 TaxID=1548601 RepID=UPI00193ED867|nr:putative thiazole-containing bacteriocin maturation protein [Bacillus sp. B15-48]MBM4764790.1 putative thiazole-containing bacteriocin maturation protein [Bacillus sp. B15-48]